MTKKLLSLLLVGLMVLALVPMSAFAKAADKKVIDTTSKFVPNKANEVATREIINDGSILNFSFESSETLTGWWTYDMDGDGNNWTVDEWGASYCYDGTYAAVSRSWTTSTGALSANNWYMTPEFVPASTSKLSFYTRSLQAQYADPIQVLIAVKNSGAYNSAHTAVVESKWTTIIANQTINTEDYQQFSYDLSSYAGQTVTVAFRHQASDCNGIMIDLVQVGVGTEVSPETGIALDQTTLALEVGAGAQLTATITPADAYFQDVTWSTSDATVAVVNKTGGVIGLAAGTATITATSHNGFTATCTVTVTGDALDDEMIAYGVGDTTWNNIDTYGALEAIQVDANSSFIVRGEYNPLDGLVYGYVNEDSAYKFCSFDPENGYARTVIATVSVMPMWMAYGFDTGVMYGCWWKDDGEMYTNVEIAVLDLTTGLEGEVLADTFASTYEYEGETNQYYCMPMFGTYAGGGYFVAYDYNYEGILAYDCGSEEFDALFIVSDLAAQLGTEPQTYVQKMWYNPIDGMLYWAGVFDTLDYVVIDVANGIMAKAGTNADEITVLYTPYEITVEPTGLPGDVDCNGEVTMADVTILAMYLNGENPEITEQGMINADANQDGTVDIRDIAAIYAIISAS